MCVVGGRGGFPWSTTPTERKPGKGPNAGFACFFRAGCLEEKKARADVNGAFFWSKRTGREGVFLGCLAAELLLLAGGWATPADTRAETERAASCWISRRGRQPTDAKQARNKIKRQTDDSTRPQATGWLPKEKGGRGPRTVCFQRNTETQKSNAQRQEHKKTSGLDGRPSFHKLDCRISATGRPRSRSSSWADMKHGSFPRTRRGRG
jgi:hypothetical protein